jgi:predicted ATPase
VEYTYTQARHLCQQIGETRYLFPAVLGLGGVCQNQAEFRKARALARQLLHLARTEGDPARLLWAHVLSGQISYLIGEFALAQKDFEEGIALYDARRHSPHISDVVQDPGVHCRCYLAEILWVQGYPDQARQLSHQALNLARRLAHSHSKAVALASAILLHNRLGEQPAARDLADEMIALTHQQGFPFWLAVGIIRRGWTLVSQGQEEQGLAQMRQGLAIFHTTGAKFALPSFFCDLAEAHERAGQVEEGLALVTEALKRIAETGEHVSEAELYRLRGELLLTQEIKSQKSEETRGWGLGADSSAPQAPSLKSLAPSGAERVEECFLKAIRITQQQQAKSLELRAVMSLVRLRRQQATTYARRTTQHATRSSLAEAHKMLAEVYNWFTEGFETADLQEARVLLEEFAG